MNGSHGYKDWYAAILLLLLFWLSRIIALESFPPHNDEGLHLTRAVEVWRLHPFWQISDGKIINHWLIAAFYPLNAPIFTSRIATIFVGLIGLAAGYALARRWFNPTAGLLTGSLWIGCAYLFFFERLALSDAEAGALVVLAVWSALRLTHTWRSRDAVLTGLALAAAILFKFTAAPFGFTALLIVLLLGNSPFKKRIIHLIIIGVVVAFCFAVPFGYLALRGRDFFDVARNWIGSGSYGSDRGALANLARLWQLLIGFYLPVWSVGLAAGLVALAFTRKKTARVLLIGASVPLLSMILLGTEVLARHYVAMLPIFIVLGGIGLGGLLDWISTEGIRGLSGSVRRGDSIPPLRRDGEGVRGRGAIRGLAAVVSILLIVSAIPFAVQLYTTPDWLIVPNLIYAQYMADHSAGFGLREAVRDFPETLTRDDLPIIGSMFPDGCRRANFDRNHDRAMQCVDAPGIPEIEAALQEYGAVYVLTDDAPNIGVDVSLIDANATRIAAYPRPDEDESNASVVLWLLEAR